MSLQHPSPPSHSFSYCYTCIAVRIRHVACATCGAFTYICNAIPRWLINSIRGCARDFLCKLYKLPSTNTIQLWSALRWPCHENGIKNALLIKSTLCAAMNWVNLQIRIRQQLHRPLPLQMPQIIINTSPAVVSLTLSQSLSLCLAFLSLANWAGNMKKLLAFDLILRLAAFVADKNDMAKEKQRKKERERERWKQRY